MGTETVPTPDLERYIKHAERALTIAAAGVLVAALIPAIIYHRVLSAGGLSFLAFAALIAAPQMITEGGTIAFAQRAMDWASRVGQSHDSRLKRLKNAMVATGVLCGALAFLGLVLTVLGVLFGVLNETVHPVTLAVLGLLLFMLTTPIAYSSYVIHEIADSLQLAAKDAPSAERVPTSIRWVAALVALMIGASLQYADIIADGVDEHRKDFQAAVADSG